MHNIFCQAHYCAQHFWQCTLLDKALLLMHIVKHNLFWLCTMLAQQFFWLICILCKLEVKSERNPWEHLTTRPWSTMIDHGPNMVDHHLVSVMTIIADHGQTIKHGHF